MNAAFMKRRINITFSQLGNLIGKIMNVVMQTIYKTLFQAHMKGATDTDQIVQKSTLKVNKVMLEHVIQIFSAEERKISIFQIFVKNKDEAFAFAFAF